MSDGIWQTVLAQARLPRFALIQSETETPTCARFQTCKPHFIHLDIGESL